MSIYLIADNHYSDEWREWVETPDLDYGYFTTEAEAQAFCDKVNAPILAANDADEARFAAELEVYHAEVRRLEPLNGTPKMRYPYRPNPRDVVTVVEVKPA